jgi:hypothetical protein
MSPYAYVVLGCVFGYLGFREARSFQRKNGRSPWGWDPLIWGFIVFLSLLIGGILLFIARRTTQPPAQWGQPPQWAPPPASGLPPQWAPPAASGLPPHWGPPTQSSPGAPGPELTPPPPHPYGAPPSSSDAAPAAQPARPW